MGSLEAGKAYGLAERAQTLIDVSRTRLNNGTPHQAPQRERVSNAAIPGATTRAASGRGRQRRKRWVDQLRPDVNMGVPQLMLMLEPNIVWEHTRGQCSATGRTVEATLSKGEFFEGWHKNGRLAHGVYEGSYWDLIGDCDEMIDMLRDMSKAPALLEEPPLELPAQADLPKWEDYKPLLQVMPSAPVKSTLKLPPFRAPMLETEVPFLEPEYEHVPDVPDAAREEPTPIFMPPELMQVEAYRELEFMDLEPPIIAEAPQAPRFGAAQYGHDWTGTRPFQKPEPIYVDPGLLDVPQWKHPLAKPDMPKFPLMEDLELDRADLEMEPIPKLELAWEAGPEPEPEFASFRTTPQASRGPSPPRSRPMSGVPQRQPSYSPAPSSSAQPPATPAPSSRPVSASVRATPAASLPPSRPTSAHPASRPTSAKPSASPSPQQPSPAKTEAQLAAAITYPAASSRPQSMQQAPSPPPPEDPWAEVVDVDAGKPRLWLNFEKPFAELPPLFIPPEPMLGETNGPEPCLDDFPCEALEELPEFEMPAPRELPEWREPRCMDPQWMAPSEPQPIGFLRGTAPVLILDVSGTMNPRMNGKFKDVKECAQVLLDPMQGELATSAGAFDVICFCSGAWSWSATYAERLALLASSQIHFSGRQVGGKPPGRGGVLDKSKGGVQLMPTEPDLLTDAQNWVAKWPDATGQTSMLTAFQLADEHWGADCWYVFSDGLAHDPSLCLDFLESRVRRGERCPIIHTVGFFPDDAPPDYQGRRYLKQLSALTGGTFQEYHPDLKRVYQDGVGFVPFQPHLEEPDETEEREWAEAQLRAERKKNIRLGIVERLDVTVARIRNMHQQQRVGAVRAAHAAQVVALRAEYDRSVAHIVDFNENISERARQEYDEMVEAMIRRNAARKEAAQAAYEEAHAAWMEEYERQLSAWEANKATLEAQHAEALRAYERLQTARSRSNSPPRSRPVSAKPASGQSRPTSASARPTSAHPTSAGARYSGSSMSAESAGGADAGVSGAVGVVAEGEEGGDEGAGSVPAGVAGAEGLAMGVILEHGEDGPDGDDEYVLDEGDEEGALDEGLEG